MGDLQEQASRWQTEPAQNAPAIQPTVRPATDLLVNLSPSGPGPGPNHSLSQTRSTVRGQAAAWQSSLPVSVIANLPLVLEPLSQRELEVLNLITLGAANQDMAAQLTVSLNTIKKHTTNIFSKLGTPNRTQAVYLARKLGLIAE